MAGQGTVGRSTDGEHQQQHRRDCPGDPPSPPSTTPAAARVKLKTKGQCGARGNRKGRAAHEPSALAAPTAAGGKGTITGVTNAMEYRASGDWEPINSKHFSGCRDLPGPRQSHRYQTGQRGRHGYHSRRRRGERGPPFSRPEALCGADPLTAVANADATGTLAYEWEGRRNCNCRRTGERPCADGQSDRQGRHRNNFQL